MGRRLGQHFLVRQSTLERIAAAVCQGDEALVIEIGPGTGSLTEHLLRHATRVVAIETDRALVERLRERFACASNLEVVEADVLETDLAQWGPAVVAGNLPYYITSPILARVLALGPLLRRAVVLVQKEVAERLTACPGSREYGYLTVRTRLAAEAEILFSIPPSAFRPPPKVDSAAVRLSSRPVVSGAVEDRDAFLHFIQRCFRQKRKTVRNNLRGVYPRDLLDACPETSQRAEQLSIDRLASLYRHLEGAAER